MARCAGILLVAVVLLGARASSAQGILGRIACIAKSPSPPTGLSADLKAEGSIALSWAAGGSGGGLLAAGPACVSGYSLTVYETGKPGTGKTFETKVPTAIISGLISSNKYTVEVRALSKHGLAPSAPTMLTGLRPTFAAGVGAWAAPSTLAPSATAEGWTCVPAEGYPACSAAGKGLCSPISCAHMARLGRCSTSFLRVLDWNSKTVTQHCAAECGSCGAAALGQVRPADFLAPPHDYCCAFGAGQYYAQGTVAGAVDDF